MCAKNPDLTRAKLLEAGFQEVYEHGFRSASIDSILARAGVTKGALYHHFSSKQALGYDHDATRHAEEEQPPLESDDQ